MPKTTKFMLIPIGVALKKPACSRMGCRGAADEMSWKQAIDYGFWYGLISLKRGNGREYATKFMIGMSEPSIDSNSTDCSRQSVSRCGVARPETRAIERLLSLLAITISENRASLRNVLTDDWSSTTCRVFLLDWVSLSWRLNSFRGITCPAWSIRWESKIVR